MLRIIKQNYIFMESIYLALIVLLFLLAASDLWVGVSNDAVNFMNSAIGSKAAKFRTIVVIAALGILCGAIMSNGMMDIARHGVFKPDLFTFNEVMTIFIAVMVTDIVLLDVFNSFGMPTSTTVSMVFELLGASFALAMIKTWGAPGTSFGDYINSGQALGMITAIFISVGIAFAFGTLIMYITRLIFTFKYKVRMKFKIGIFGGLAITAIMYFMLFKGVKNLSFMTPETKSFIDGNILVILLVCFVVLSVVMQVLHFMKVNVLRIVVLFGTFALAMAFAGNDLVNFIGVPLAGYSSYVDFTGSGAGNPDTYMMSSLLESARTPIGFLVGAGIIMAMTLALSKKARRVTETEVNLSRQDAGNEMFGSSRVARSLVRMASSAGNAILRITPEKAQKFVESRFQRPVEAVNENAAAYDLLRASVNLVVSALLIALGTSLKLPLSTTYVTFMVAMGSSFADRAWGRESAVFRITGVLTVIGGWFITAAVAFISCFTIAMIMHYGGFVAQVVLITIAVAMLIHSNINYAKRKKADKGDALFYKMLSSTNSAEIVKMLQEHVGKNVAEITDGFSTLLIDSTDGLFNEKLHALRKSLNSVKKYKVVLKSLRRREIICLRRADVAVAVKLSTPFHLLHNALFQLYYSLLRICRPSLEHVDNNFLPIDPNDAEVFKFLRGKVVILMNEMAGNFAELNLADGEEIQKECASLKREISDFRDKMMVDIQTQNCDITATTLLLHLLQELEQILHEIDRLIYNMRKFARLAADTAQPKPL